MRPGGAVRRPAATRGRRGRGFKPGKGWLVIAPTGYLVALLIFPIVGRRFSMWWVEMSTFLVFVFSAAVSGLVVFSGGA